MERGDIYLVSLDPTSCSEQQGKRPVLVVSPSAKRTLLPPIIKNRKFINLIGRGEKRFQLDE